MRRLKFFTAGLAVLALLGAGPAGASNPLQGADIFGVGGGHVINQAFGTFDFSAHKSPTRDFGHVGVHSDNLDIYVDVDCVSDIHVFGSVSTVYMGGVVRSVTERNVLNLEPGDRQFFFVQDGGNPSGETMVDGFYPLNITIGGMPAETCDTVLLFFLPANVSEGNVNIRLG